MTTLGVRVQPRVAPVRNRVGWPAVAMAAVLVVAAVHALVVAGHYAVGSFDDDGHYLSMAHALASGKGYVDTSAPGAPTESVYPPGYPVLLVPLIWLFGSAYWPLRAVSLLAFLGCIPLLDALLRRYDVGSRSRFAVLLLFALNPVAATFATEVMPESVFLLVLLIVLLGLHALDDHPPPRWAAVAVVVGAPYLLLAKSAGLPMLVAAAGWVAWRRRWRILAALGVATAAFLGPVLLARLGSGSVVGDRYTSDYARSGPLLHAVWSGISHYVSYAIPASLVPTQGAFLYGHTRVLDLAVDLVRVTAAPAVVVGILTWWWRRRDVTLLLVPLYLAETVPFPYVNERRVILVLPLVVTWYVVGWTTVGRGLARSRPLAALSPERLRYAVVLPALFVVALLVDQLPRDYLLRLGESTPRATGSGYVAALRADTPSGWSVATAYRWTIAQLTGRTATNVEHFTLSCRPGAAPDPARVRARLARAHVATVLDADVKWPDVVDNACVLQTLAAAPWAARVYTGSDNSTVFALTGPGTPRPDPPLVGVAAQPPGRGAAIPVAAVREVSVEVAADPAAVGARIEVRLRNGRWTSLPTTRTGAPLGLLDARPAVPVTATAVRVVGLPVGARLQHLVVFGAPS